MDIITEVPSLQNTIANVMQENIDAQKAGPSGMAQSSQMDDTNLMQGQRKRKLGAAKLSEEVKSKIKVKEVRPKKWSKVELQEQPSIFASPRGR